MENLREPLNSWPTRNLFLNSKAGLSQFPGRRPYSRSTGSQVCEIVKKLEDALPARVVI